MHLRQEGLPKQPVPRPPVSAAFESCMHQVKPSNTGEAQALHIIRMARRVTKFHLGSKAATYGESFSSPSSNIRVQVDREWLDQIVQGNQVTSTENSVSFCYTTFPPAHPPGSDHETILLGNPNGLSRFLNKKAAALGWQGLRRKGKTNAKVTRLQTRQELYAMHSLGQPSIFLRMSCQLGPSRRIQTQPTGKQECRCTYGKKGCRSNQFHGPLFS